MISLFDRDDEEMLTCKSGEWYITHPYRARSNNSAVLPRGEVSQGEFARLMTRIEQSGCGEPGVYWTNNKDWGTNPCCEIALRPYQMCNLTEIDAGKIKHQKDFNKAAEAAAFIGTLQAGYTDFHYLNPKWKIACEKDALLGVSMTGIASGTVEKLDMEWAAECVRDSNKVTAKRIGIREAARTTCVKPAGTTSLVLGTSSGIHAWHAPYYIRRMRAGKDEALAIYMAKAAPGLVEQDVTKENQVVLSFPQCAPEGATVRSETMGNLLERVKNVSTKGVAAGHVDGINQHNVSCTISVKDNEWEELGNWMWANRDHYNGISVLPYFGAEAYPQLPFEDITKEQYEAMLPMLEGIDISQVFEENGVSIDLKAELACAGGGCEIQF
jgi:ribonucleoside-diphosphate reductase alpha chain